MATSLDLETGKSRTDPYRSYAAIVVYWSTSKDPQLIADDSGRIVVFDNKAMAQHFIPRLGDGRITTFSRDGETVWFNPIIADSYNRADIIVPYDVYNLPPNHPVLSETRGSHIGWKRHIHYGEWIDNLARKNEEHRKRMYDALSEELDRAG